MWDRPVNMGKPEDVLNGFERKVDIFEISQQANVCSQADHEVYLSPCPLGRMDKKSSRIIDENQQKQDEDILRDEVHVKIAAGYKQQYPAESLRCKVVQQYYYGKEQYKFIGAE